MRILPKLVFVLAVAAPLQQAAAASGGVYVSGPGSSVEQAFAQALAENPRKTNDAFWIVVAGAEVARMTKGSASPDIVAWTKTVRERGGLVYVCRSDLVRAGIREEDLLDGVIAMYGYGAKDWSGLLPARKDGIALPDNIKQSQLILRTCATDQPAS